MKVRLCFVVLLVVFVVGCGQAKKEEVKDVSSFSDKHIVESVTQSSSDEVVNSESKSPAFNPFYVFSDKGSRDNHYVPSGFMPNGQCITFNDMWTEGCHGGKTCVKIEYDVECSRHDQKWAGIYWLNPANNWGNKKGGFNLTGAEKLTFWARGEKGGEQIEEFTIGGITGKFPDTDIAVIGPVILTPEWREYTIDLRGKDLAYISGGFAWSTNAEVNQDDCVFYLDNIQFE
jgi:hypothetical protein